MSSYDHLTKEQLIALFQRREREASYGLSGSGTTMNCSPWGRL